jgi:adenosylcobyric acid synthase
VVLIGDIDRGGVIASLVGTHAVLDARDRRRIAASSSTSSAAILAVRRRHADHRRAHRLAPRRRAVVSRAAALPAEDAAWASRPGRGRRRRPSASRCRVLPRIANFDDLDPLKAPSRASTGASWCSPASRCPATPTLSSCPAPRRPSPTSPSLRAQGWDIDIAAHVRRGGHVLGICGGYQMLGRAIADPDGIEGRPAPPGLGLLDVETRPWLDRLRAKRGLAAASTGTDWDLEIDAALDALADHIAAAVPLDRLLAIAREAQR